MRAWILPWMMIMSAAKAVAADEPKALPAAMLMPLRPVAIDAEELAALRPDLDRAQQALVQALMQNPKPLPTVNLKSPRLTVNFRRRAEKILTGTAKSASPALPFAAVEATWCSVMDRHLFFVTVADARSNQLLASRHVAVPRAQAKAALQKLPALLAEAWTAATERARTPKTENLNVGLFQGEDSTRRDEGSGYCTAMLLEEKLAPDYTIARSLGHDYLAMARDLLELPPKLTRPTRGVVMSLRQPNQLAPKRTLPVTLDLVTRFAETVYGQHLPVEPKTSPVEIRQSGDRLDLVGLEPLKKTLDAEKATLLLADRPEAAKIDRAWVYVDRGRAWGLKMNDRLVATVDGQTVKGHVVKFFGPELKIKSPRGFLIEEGAIVYVRKNQKLAKVGMTWQADGRQYPTPYPIPPGK